MKKALARLSWEAPVTWTAFHLICLDGDILEQQHDIIVEIEPITFLLGMRENS
jgi:hypothetical protein